MPDQTSKSIEQRIQELEDHNDITRTLRQYGLAVDYGDNDGVVDCFTSDAVREIHRPDGTVNRWEGADEMRQFARNHSHAPDKYHKHLTFNSIVELDGDAASVTSYMFRFDASDGDKTHIWGMGRHLDKMRRDPDGKWRILERITYIEDDWPGRSRPKIDAAKA